MKEHFNILLVEDVPEDIRYIKLQLESIFQKEYTLETTDYFSKALKLCENNSYDVVLLDLSLPDSNGLTNFKKLAKLCNTPIIVYTGLVDEMIRSEVLKLGAEDYLIKGITTDGRLKQSIVDSIIRFSSKRK